MTRNAAARPAFIGPYRVLECIGEGGSADVYLCEQQHPIRRRVAVKLLRDGMDAPAIVERFRREPQLLAQMEHPDIVRIFEAGENGRGMPYFAMEYVAGVPLVEYCNERSLGVRERIELVIAVCSAVTHVHQKGVVHGDLKPANVVVTDVDGKAQPKLIDFGVARASFDARSASDVVFIATPQYMSPEQSNPVDGGIDTRSDIYSIGAMLYELLAGRPPLVRNGETRSLLELQQLLHTRRPVPPSHAGAADSRTVNGVRSVQRELDWITLKALETDPAMRYETAADLAADLRRFLDKQPVLAARPGRLYALRKLAERHSLAAAFVGLAMTTLLAFTVNSAVQAEQLRIERDRVRHETLRSTESTEFLVALFSLGDPQTGLGDVTVHRALDFGEKYIDDEVSGEPEVRNDLLFSVARIYNRIGLPADAERVLVKVLADATLKRSVRDEVERELVRARVAQLSE